MFMVTRMETLPTSIYALSSPIDSPEAMVPQAAPPSDDSRLQIFVIYTKFHEAVAALHAAERLAQQLGALVRLVMPYEVSYKLPLDRPPVLTNFLRAQLADAAAHAAVDVEGHVCLCRDKRDALKSLMPPNSLVVIGGKNGWWPSESRRLARHFQKLGHHVIFGDGIKRASTAGAAEL
jgi:hypothetical protein